MKKIIVLSICLILFSSSLSIAEEIDKDCNCNNLLYTERLVSNEDNFHLSLMIHEFRIRSYWTYLPSSYDGANAVPLVVLLHSYGNNGWLESIRTELNLKSENEGFIVVYPNGATFGDNKGWNAGFCCGPSMRQNIDDLGFIKSVIEKTKKNYNIDTNRIYVAGFSNGAMMTNRFAAEFSEELAAIAVVDGAIGGNISDFRPSLLVIPKPSDPLPVIIFHGTKDHLIPYEGGRRPCDNKILSHFLPIYLPVNDSVKFWVEHNKCNPIPEVNIIADENVILKNYTNGTNGSEVVFYTILNGSHWWFGGAWLPNRNNDPYNYISSTNLIWEFFEKHPKK
jgi:polyhydroxybutyrate depolymerase